MDIMKIGKNPNYLGSWDLEDIPNHELTLTIKDITEETVVGAEGRKEKNAICYFVEPYKPMVLNKTNKKTLVKMYKTKETKNLIGKRFTIIAVEVKAFGEIVDGLRIKKVKPDSDTISLEKCEICGGDINPTSSMTSKQIADYSRAKFGKAMCTACGKEMAAKIKEQQQITETEVTDNENNENND